MDPAISAGVAVGCSSLSGLLVTPKLGSKHVAHLKSLTPSHGPQSVLQKKEGVFVNPVTLLGANSKKLDAAALFHPLDLTGEHLKRHFFICVHF